MKRFLTFGLCLFLVLASATWALAKCRSVTDRGGHGGHVSGDLHHTEHSANHTSSEQDHRGAAIHCTEYDLQLGAMVRLATAIVSGPYFQHVIASVATPNENSNALRTHSIRVHSHGKFRIGISSNLFLSVLQI